MPTLEQVLPQTGFRLTFPEQEWTDFRERNARWFVEQQSTFDPLHCFPTAQVESYLRLFDVDPEFVRAEQEFSELCDRNHAIGIYDRQFLRTALLRPALTWPSSADLSSFLKLGWTLSDIASVKSLSEPTAKIHRRLHASVGRLISTPNFNSECQELQTRWKTLPAEIRPDLPIRRSSIVPPHARKFDGAPEELAGFFAKYELQKPSEELVEFLKTFDGFCDRWQLLGVITWRIPEVQGPHWVPSLQPKELRDQGLVAFKTPWHFTILGEDGLGPLIESEHRRWAEEKYGVQDPRLWETYARMFEIHHWEGVLASRYNKGHRVRGFVTEMESVLGAALGLSQDRVHELRKKLKALQRGSIKSLRGNR
jgi:hypothetical protein